MIKFEHTEVVGWEAAIRGMRNPLNSWEKSDSGTGCTRRNCWGKEENGLLLCKHCSSTFESKCICQGIDKGFKIGLNDYDLMKRLRNTGTDHRKYLRMIVVYVDITAPLYWWKEFDTYKVGTVANSCSTMHKIAAKEFTLEDFSTEHLIADDDNPMYSSYNDERLDGGGLMGLNINVLNYWRKKYLETKDKKYWWQMIQLLPSSYNQKRTVMLNYEVLANMYKSRKNHKLDEWKEHFIVREPDQFGFCDWIKTLPYSELITGDFKEE